MEFLLFYGIIIITITTYWLVMEVDSRTRCKTMVHGMYLGYDTEYGARATTSYYPRFEYEFEGKKYNGRCALSMGEYELSSYEVGDVHPIWIDKECPDDYLVKKTTKKDIVLMVLRYGLLYAMGIFSLACLGFAK